MAGKGYQKDENKQEIYEKRGYLLSDFRLFHLSDAQGTKVDYHYHEFHKLLFLCSGTGDYSVEGQKYTLQAGDIVLIGSRQVHRPEFEKGMPYERIILYISPEFLKENSVEECDLEEIFKGVRGENFGHGQKAGQEELHVLRTDEKERRHLFSLVEKLERELSEEVYGKEIACKGLLLRLLVETGRRLKNRELKLQEQSVSGGQAKGIQKKKIEHTPQQERIRRMMRYLDTHLNEEISMDTLAEQFYVSKYHMMRQFQEETGQTIYDYLTERRLLHARDFIRQGYSATESCFQSGFRSYSSFTRAYAKRFGTTPTGRAGRNMQREETFE